MGAHVAILRKPYLDAILRGDKAIESRFSRQRRDPFGRVSVGDTIYLKESGGPYRGAAIAERVLCFGHATPELIEQLRADYEHMICAGDAYWRSKRDAAFVTLVWLASVRSTDDGPDLSAIVAPVSRHAWHCLDSVDAATP